MGNVESGAMTVNTLNCTQIFDEAIRHVRPIAKCTDFCIVTA